MKKIIIGSRGSDLALWQANFVKDELEKLGQEVEIKVISTQGDRIQHLSFDKMEGKGFFTKEIEAALLDKSIDLAVHSHKDLETTSPKGLKIAAVSHREDPSELLLIRNESVDNEAVLGIKKNPIIGTSSARRKSQLITFRDDLEIKDLRGNVGTRINKLREGQYDAIVLAMAGVKRLDLDLSDLTISTLDPTMFIPAPAQGVLGLQIREEDEELSAILSKMNDTSVANRIAIERGVLKQLNGGCQLPLGIYCDTDNTVHVAFAEEWKNGAEFSTYSANDNVNIVDEITGDLQAS
ncbi:hydroxymethylbilane synthase [Brumimicrobium aurantiacum]|uniref:Hydroxymethylbilane synthase n=1 Tax=Brumimicrobium aurantiacum TaxID=1737063 RepID=A0A3E1F1U5_9FLAO|nr:hydroxymethylbilane synthase [Brumimicrobium aurantiacum]RFC55802.1 hydroxymethylbilane synthase [Brumimicrobium aurantiacum]